MSSSRPEQQVVQHFSHVHPLTKVEGLGEFTCDGCKTYGFGKTYRCTRCNYDLHDHCATCARSLRSFMHPQHELQLVLRGPDQMHQNRRMCDICDELIEGLYYHCEPCGFDAHPLCTRLPQHVRHVPHPAHLLELSQWGANNTCVVCHGAIRSWRYKCGQCRVDVHMECVSSTASGSAREIQQRSFGSQPQYHHQNHYHQPYYNYGYGYTNQGHVVEAGPSMGRKMFSILMALTIGVVCNIVAAPVSEVLTGCF